MNQKQVLILLVLVAVIGGAGLVIHNKKQSAYQGGTAQGEKVLPDLKVNDVAGLSIRHDTNAVTLVKKDDLWRVRERNDYPANFVQISDLIRKAADLKVVQTEKVGASQLARIHLAEQGTNPPITIEFLGQDAKPLQALLLGKQQMKKPTQPSQFGDEAGWPEGRYVKLPKSDEVLLVKDPLELQLKPETWLDKEFIRIEKPSRIEVIYSEPTNSWKLSRETESGDWTLANASTNEPLDSSKVAGVSNPFSSPSFNDVQQGNTLDASGTNKPVQVTIDTFDHFRYALAIGEQADGNYPVTVSVSADLPKERVAGADEKPEDKARLDKEFKEKQDKLVEKLKREQGFAGWTYLVQSWTVDPLLQKRHQLIKVEEPKTEEAAADSTEAGMDPDLQIEDPPSLKIDE